LVDRQLAKDWEDKLSAPPHLHEAYHRRVQAPLRALSGAEREAISALAQDLPALWHAPTPMVDRKVRRRQSIHRALVTREGTKECLQITINWVGGRTTAGSTTRPISRIEHLSYHPQVWDWILTLVQAGYSTAQNAERPECEGYRPPTQAARFRRQTVHKLMSRRTRQRPPRAEHDWWVSDVRRRLGIPKSAHHAWRLHSWLQTRWDTPTRR
jgi:hypothetical protein